MGRKGKKSEGQILNTYSMLVTGVNSTFASSFNFDVVIEALKERFLKGQG